MRTASLRGSERWLRGWDSNLTIGARHEGMSLVSPSGLVPAINLEPQDGFDPSPPPYQGGVLPLAPQGRLEPLTGLEPVHHPYKRWVLPSHSERHSGAGDGNRTHDFWLEARHVAISTTPAWSGIRESNPCYRLGKPVRYHYNNPALGPMFSGGTARPVMS